jgi:hypothetical protein
MIYFLEIDQNFNLRYLGVILAERIMLIIRSGTYIRRWIVIEKGERGERERGERGEREGRERGERKKKMD